MSYLNVEIKARCKNTAHIRSVLEKHQADFIGEDHQTDTYFNVEQGRLKLREGNIENALIYYRRPDQSGPKPSEVMLYHPHPGSSLKELLTAALGVKVVVTKTRGIFFAGNVKFHLDRVAGLGTFVEIEAIDKDGSIGEQKLREQCNHYLKLFDIKSEELIENSYSDMLMKNCDSQDG